MARLIEVSAASVAQARTRLSAPAMAGGRFKVSRPGTPAMLEPWFELTPRLPCIDSRVSVGSGGVVAWLETYGGVTGPALARPSTGDAVGDDEIVLAGNPAPPGTPGPESVEGFRRQCAIRVAIMAQDLEPNRQLLLIIPARGLGPTGEATFQVFLASHALAQDQVRGDDRLAVLLQVPSDGRLCNELWIRLCGHGPDAAVGIRGVQGILL